MLPAKIRKNPVFANKILEVKKYNKFYLYTKFAFFALKSKRATPCVCAILCALVDNLLEQNWGLLMIFLKDFPQNPPINGKVGRGPRDL